MIKTRITMLIAGLMIMIGLHAQPQIAIVSQPQLMQEQRGNFVFLIILLSSKYPRERIGVMPFQPLGKNFILPQAFLFQIKSHWAKII